MKKFMAVLIAALIMGAMLVNTVAANDLNDGKAGSGGSKAAMIAGEKIKIKKVLTAYNKDETQIYAPAFSYTYAVTPGSADKKITDNQDSPVSVLTKVGILAGLKVTGSENGTANTAIIGDSSSTDVENSISWTNDASLTAGDGGTANTQNLELDFSGVVFPGAGVYRYVITEKPGGQSEAAGISSVYAAAGITDSANKHVRYLDVYVKDGSSTGADAWDVYAFALFDSDIDLTPSSTGKENGFLDDKYYTYNVTVSKTLSGDKANNDHEFPFTVNFTNSSVTQPVKVKTKTVKNGGSAADGTDLSGTLSTATTGIQDNPGIDHQSSKKYIGIPVGITAATAATVHERNDVTGTTYTSVYKVDNGNDKGSKRLAWSTAETDTGAVSETAAVTPAVNPDDEVSHTVEFTNTMDIISPTGLVLRFTPYIIMAVAAVFLLIIARRRKDNKDTGYAI